jgi:hypothetical protein
MTMTMFGSFVEITYVNAGCIQYSTEVLFTISKGMKCTVYTVRNTRMFLHCALNRPRVALPGTD